MDWKRKLTSRKLWAAVVSFVALLVIALGGTEAQATQVTALIMAGASVIAYIVGEGMADAAGAVAIVTTNGDPAITGIGENGTPTEAYDSADASGVKVTEGEEKAAETVPETSETASK